MYKTKTSQNLLLVATTLLLLVNLFVIYQFTLFENRVLRTLGTLVFLLFIIRLKPKDTILLVAFFLFLVVDIATIFYENIIFNKLASLFKMIGYLGLIFYIFKKVKLVQLKNFLWVFSAVLIALTLYLMQLVLSVAQASFIDGVQNILFYCYGFIIILLGSFTAYYHTVSTSSASLFFLFFVFGIVLSDICGFIGYYLGFESYYFLDRIFYLFGFYFFIKHIWVSTKEVKNSFHKEM